MAISGLQPTLWDDLHVSETTKLDIEALAESILAGLVSSFPVGYYPEIVWSNLRVTAGMADYRLGQITLSRRLLINEDRLVATLIHEYAHLLAVARKGRRAAGHGEAWKQAMSDLGQTPNRTHDYPVERNRSYQEIAYRCAKCGQLLIRKRRLPRRRKYFHVGCGGTIRFEAAMQVASETTPEKGS